MNDYQMPLFARYDMSVEFEMHISHVRRTLRSDWEKYSRMSDDELAHNFCCEIACIELFPHDAVLAEVESLKLTLFELSVPSHGDDSMWNLYPAEPIYSLDGEVFRGELILQASAKDAKIVMAIFENRLCAIGQVLEQQAQRVAIFDMAAPSMIVNEVRKLRAAKGPEIQSYH